MILSAGIQSVSANHSPNLLLQAKSVQSRIVSAPKSPSISLKFKPRRLKISASSSSRALESSNDEIQAKEKLCVVVRPMEKPRLVLKFVWMENNIGIAIDQVIPGGHGTIPVSPYYFWPRKDAWEELKVMLESKAWISNKQKVVLLNHATDVINLWQQREQGN